MIGLQNDGCSYQGTVNSSLFSGEAQLVVEKEGLNIDALFSADFIDYADTKVIMLDNFTVRIVTENDTIVCSGLGNSCEWFFNDLKRAYNDAVTGAFLITSGCSFETDGNIAFENISTKGSIKVFDDCICLLPANKNGRRIPLAFLNGMKKENPSLILSLTTGEQYTLSMLGRDLDPLEKAITDAVRALRNKNGEFMENLCPSLSPSERTKAAGGFPQGLAFSIKKLAVFPALEKAVMQKIANSKMKQTWAAIMKMCDGQRMCVGIEELPEEEVERLKQQMMESMAEQETEEAPAELTPEQEDALRWILWAAAPSKDGSMAVVEFAFPNEAAATYIFRTEGEWETFITTLNRCMEATDLNREVIALSGEALAEAEHRKEKMLVSRTPAIAQIRSRFAGKVIHRTDASWEAGVRKHLEP